MTRYHFVNIMRWQFRVGAWSNLSYTCRSSGFIGFDHTPNKIITSWYSRIHYWFFFSIDKLTTIDWLIEQFDWSIVIVMIDWFIDWLIVQPYTCSPSRWHDGCEKAWLIFRSWFLSTTFAKQKWNSVWTS